MRVKFVFWSCCIMLAVGLGAWTLKKDKKIIWQQTYRLTWNDYQAKPDVASTKNVQTWYGMEANTYMLSGENSERVYAYVDRSRSWVKDTFKASLPHEQLHFDIAELYARMMRESISQLKEKSYERRAEIVTKMSQDYGKLMMTEQDRYDQETENGLNTVKQEEWRVNVQKRLKQYGIFK